MVNKTRAYFFRTMVHKLCSTDPMGYVEHNLGSATSSQGVHGYISVKDSGKFSLFCKLNV